MQSGRRLCTQQLAGTSKDKLGITVGLTGNGTKTPKIPPWIIEKSDNLHYF